MLPRIKTMSHMAPFFLLPHPQYRCSTLSLPPTSCQKKRPVPPSCPFFKNYDLHCLSVTVYLQNEKMESTRWKDRPPNNREKKGISMQVPPQKVSSSTLGHVVFQHWVRSCLFPLRYLQEVSISLA